ncbi:murein biosynthesis integral membrane protein MurJ [Nesterenkonia sp. HG001]|uniref:murein biosynthesis integral membrane protein MurJ n=1 Tax=Nesterenkonia sp. HG001 TaxID=2983207 RepID=UPI002AC64C9F|nr:lipid II flippase MurJ [Nesterenkonia sp. HG001]MDZ5077374.1 murein biosynthesis protein MurJ [Nesterenkonia sp. HG001]
MSHTSPDQDSRQHDGDKSPDTHIPQGGMARASALMASGTMVSRMLGFIRTALLAVAIGSTALVADVFEKANTIPNVIYMLLAGGMFNVVLVPQLIKAAKRPDRGSDYTSRLLTLCVLVLGAFTILLTLAAYPLMVALTKDWTEPMLALGTAFALWTLPQVFFYGLYAVIGQILNANAKFGWYMWAPVLNNVIAIGVIGSYLVMFGRFTSGTDQAAEWTTQQTLWLAGGHTVGIIAQAAILIWPLMKIGFPIRPKFGWKGMGLRSTGQIAAWTLATMLISNIANLLYMRLISGATASREQMADGGASIPGEYAANTAQLITVLPHSVFVLSLATVLFNQLARSMDLGRLGRAREIINEGLRMFAIPVMFSMVAVIVLAGPLGRLFGGSAETAHLSGAAIGQLLILLALGMPFRSANFYLMRVFYSAEDARTPMLVHTIIAALCLACAYGGALVLPNETLPFLVIGLFSLFHVVQYVLCHVWVVRRWGSFGFSSVVAAYARSGWAAVIAGLTGAAVLWLLGGYSWGFAWQSILTALITCTVVGTVMGVVFVMMLKVMRVREFDDVMAPLARRIPALARLSR